MFKSIKKLTLILAVFSGMMLFSYAVPSSVLAAPKDEVCKGVGMAGGESGCDSGSDITVVTKQVINIMTWVLGFVAVVMIIIAGFNFVTSAGDAQKAAKARMTILYALIGLAVAAMAQVIVLFVLDKL